MNTKTYLKGAGVLLLTAILLVSATAVTANTNNLTMMNPGAGTHQGTSARDIIWDNDMTYEALLASQNDPVYGELGSCADDFQLTATTNVTIIHLIGGYWNGAPGAVGWQITFYADDGTGTKPGAIVSGPTTYPNAQVNEQFVELIGTSYFYSYDITLTTPVTCQAGAKYWIGFQGQQVFPPQSGVAGHSAVALHEMKFKSSYFPYPDWTDGSIVFGTAYDIAFQLEGSAPTIPVPNLDCQGSLGWSKVKPGSTVNGSFTVMNVGEDDSLLNWQVTSSPSWGTWTFTPNAGTGLAKGASVTVTVSVVAPPDKKTNFTGNVTIVNSDNASDFCVIPVFVSTPLYQQPWLERFFTLFPHAFPILRHLLGY